MEPTVYSVKQFNELVNTVLQTQIGEVTIKGEISGFQIRQNKWVTFDLKEEGSVINCFMSAFQLDFPVNDGMEVLITGTPRVYVPYGKYSLTVRTMQLKGEGALKKAFDELKAKLEKEGLFDPQHKRALPRFPERIGIITSGDGAAINDVLKVINHRWGGLQLFLAPVLVQGKNAPDELVGALEYFNQHHPVDIIIFGRGGGSLEDLQAFNSERVARAIFSSRIPIVAGIGHEHNTSIADLVADIRAATPSNAAEIAVPDRQTIRSEIDLLGHQASERLERKITHAGHHLRSQTQTLQLFIQGRLGDIRLMIQKLYQQISDRRQAIQQFDLTLTRTHQHLAERYAVRFERAARQAIDIAKLLQALNPSAILKRGYSITYAAATSKPITRLADIPTDGRIKTQVSDGDFETMLTASPPESTPRPPQPKPITKQATTIAPEVQSSLF